MMQTTSDDADCIMTHSWRSTMQTLHYTVGPWRAQAQLEELETGKLMAVIDVIGESADVSSGSRHTVVFERDTGMDKAQQTENLVKQLLQDRYRLA
jgi:hypothetical protein